MHKLVVGILVMLIPSLTFACYNSGELLINIALLPVIILWVGVLIMIILSSLKAKKNYSGRFNILLGSLTVILVGLFLGSYYLNYKDNLRIKEINECEKNCIENEPCFCNSTGC